LPKFELRKTYMEGFMRVKKILLSTLALFFSAFLQTSDAEAVFTSGSTGADGAFNPVSNTALQVPENGVFNFTTVNIPTGVTVTFLKNSANTPITILATGDVIIGGTLDLDGTAGSGSANGWGGPGGYDGGIGGAASKPGYAAQGPGAGGGGTTNGSSGASGGGGGYGAAGGAGSAITGYEGRAGVAYGNERVLPLIGGSGGGGGAGISSSAGFGGGGGGGAILIASSGNITNSGYIKAQGGVGGSGTLNTPIYGGGGSGGSSRLIANGISNSGYITATGGTGGGNSSGSYAGGTGGKGRIRFEAFTLTAGTTNPTYVYGVPSDVVPSNTPTLSVVSIGGVAAPAAPKGTYAEPDVQLPSNITNPVSVEVAATNIPVETTITVNAVPQVGTVSSASATLSGTEASSSATVQVNLSLAYPNIFNVTATYTLSASLDTPVYVDGERVERVQVASLAGGETVLTYITESGREIRGSM